MNKINTILLFTLLTSSYASHYSVANITASKPIDLVTTCLEKLVSISENNIVVIISNKNRRNLLPINNFTKISIFSDEMQILKQIESTPNLFTLSYVTLAELNSTLSEIEGVHYYWTHTLSTFVIIANKRQHLDKICKLLWKHHFTKHIILLQESLKVKMYTIDFQNCQCGNKIKPTKINEYDGKFFERKLTKIDPNLKKSFKNCSMTFGGFPVPPYVLKTDSSESGIAVDLLKTFESSSGIIIYYNIASKYFEQASTQNLDVVLKDMNAGQVDLFIGLETRYREQKLTFTPFAYSHMFIMVPEPKIVPTWTLVRNIYDLEVIIMLAVLVMLSSLYTTFWIVLKEDRRNKFYLFINSVISHCGTILAVPMTYHSKHWNIRFVLGKIIL